MKSYQYLLYILVLCVIGMLLAECSQPESTQLYIIPSNETPCPPKITCQTLEFVAQNPEQFFTNNCTVYFLHGIHYLPTTDFILIEQKSNLSLIGNVTLTPNVLQSGSTVQCNGQGGFRFSAIENLLIQNLRFNNCGAYHNFTVIATLLFQSVTNLTISGAAVYNSTGIGLYAENVVGSSIISNSSFFFNGAFTELVGGNLRLLWSMECAHSVESPTFVIENSTFAYGQNRQGASGGIQTDLSLCEKVKVFIRHCVILANSGGAGGNLGITILDHRNWHKQKVEIIIEDTSIQHGMAETGGGIGLVLNTQDEKLVNHTTVQKKYKAIISNSTFISNRAYYHGGGGGIFVAADFTILRMEVSNTTFLHNSALGSTGGGVLIVTKCSYLYSFEPELLELLISDSVFANNTAIHGGGLNIRSEHSYVLDCVKNHFTTVIQDTTFTDNAATYSSSAMSFSISSIQTPNCLVMKNVHLHRNQINATISAFAHEHSDSSGGFATVSIVNSPNVTITNCSYLENLGTALVTVGSNILFTGNNSFTNNTGNRGGGMAMSSSYMLLSCHSHLWFQNNQALFGGAIYIQEQELLSFNEPCFYVPTYLSNGTVSEPSVKHLYFEGNTAQYAGDVLYGGSIDTCTMHSSHNNQLTGTSFDTLSNFASQFGDSVVASNPDMMCLCINNEPKCENRSMSIEIVSGKSFTLSLVATGQRFGIAPSEIHSTILSEVQTNNFLQQSIHQLESSCTNVTFTLYSVSAVETIALSVENTLSLGKANLITSKSLLIEATLSPCPVGFVLSGEPPRCNCAPALLEHQLRCDVLNWTIQRKGTWIGFYEENASGILLHDHCPFDYCKETQMWINISSADQQCAFNRTGILCGKCKEGLSLVLGSSRCLQCSNSYLSLVLVFALAGVLLVLAIRISNLTVSFGKISSLIFYANIIQINRLLFLPEDTNVLTVFIAWLNLDFGIVTCFYNGMDSFAKMLLQFVFPSYLCIIAGAIIIASHYSSKLSRLFGNRSVSVIATLILIADAKLLRSAITILSVTSLKYPDSSISTLWLYDGNIGYWDIRHISLVIIACCIILLHFVLLSLLLFIQCFQRSSHLTCLSWIWKLKPYFDAYTAPHKNRYRFWTGLLLLFRIILFVFSLFSPTFSLFAIVLGGCCLLMLGWCFGGVHKHNVLNILEAFILLNLVFIAVFTIYAQSSGSQWIRIAMVYTSVGTVFILFLTITIYEIVSSNPWIKRWVCRLRQSISRCKCCWHHQRELSTIGSPVPQSSHLLKPLTLTFDKDSEAVLIEENNSQTRIQRVIMDEDGELTLMVEDCESQSGMSTWRQTDSDEPTLVEEDQSIQATLSTQRVTEETLVEFIHATIQQPTLFEDSCESDVDSSVDGLKQSYNEGTEMDQGKRLSLIESDISNKVLNTSLVAANEHHPFTHMRPLTPTLYNHKEASVLSKVHEPGFGDVLEVQHSILQQQSGTLTYVYDAFISLYYLLIFLSSTAATSTDSGLTHTSSELTQTSSELNLQLPLAVPYLDPIEVVTFDHSGGEYTNKAHNIIIRAPRGAIPKGVKVNIEVGVTLHGPFSFPQNTKPVSPIVWLCMQQDVHLRKPVEVVLPHCICGLKEGEHDDLELRFLKANHHDVVGSAGQSAYNFLPLEGEATFTPTCGTVHTQHFCFQCISAKKSREVVQRSGYCLSRVIPHPWPAAQSQIFIYFCVTYLMETCLEVSCPLPNQTFVHNLLTLERLHFADD